MLEYNKTERYVGKPNLDQKKQNEKPYIIIIGAVCTSYHKWSAQIPDYIPQDLTSELRSMRCGFVWDINCLKFAQFCTCFR